MHYMVFGFFKLFFYRLFLSFCNRDNEVHTQGHTFSKFITTSKDIGNVTAVAVRYDKTTSLITGWAYPEKWQLLGVSLLEAETSHV